MFQRLIRRFQAPAPTLSSLDAYALWAQNYPPHVHNPLMQAEESAMLDLMPPLAEKVVLDLACGSGRFSRIARESHAKQVIALDNSYAMLATGIHALVEDAPQFGQATLTEIPLKSNSIDVILCGLAVGHIPNLAPALAEMSRILKPSGIALISDFHPFLFLSGKQRTFTAPDGKTFAVEHYAHLHSRYWSAGSAVNLTVTALEEPRLMVDGHDVPVVVVYRLQKA